MAELKETPRQKMMGILYLVLLGIAATTVTDHVLDAFHNLTVNLENSSSIVQKTVDNSFASFEATEMKSDPLRAKPNYDRAQKVRTILGELNDTIMAQRTYLETAGGGVIEGGDVKARADVDISPRDMVRKGRAAKLKSKINDTRDQLLKILTPQEQQGLKLSLNADDPKPKQGIQTKWEEENFGEGIPLTAAITALTKIQADLKNTENEVVSRILQVKVNVVLDQFKAVVVPTSTYILDGQQYQARVFLAASSSTSNPEITVGGQRLNTKDGEGMYTVTASGTGERKWTGLIRVKQVDGTVKEYKTDEQSFTVAPPSATVSPDKMNVFYIGVENPVSVSAPGFAMDKVHVSITAGEIKGSGGNGKYTVNVMNPGEVTVNVSGEIEKGKTVSLGTSKFRVKRIPPPHLKFGGKGGGVISSAAMRSQNRIFAVIDDFEFPAPFNITHLEVYISKPRSDVQRKEGSSNQLTPDMMSAINGLTPGSSVSFYADGVGVDKVKRSLDPIVFTVQ